MDDIALRFGVALGLGMLIGLERERIKASEGGLGVRTFALIALGGALAGYLDMHLQQRTLALLMFGAFALLVLCMYVVTALRGDPGITTETSALLCFVLGVLCTWGELQVASWVAVALTLLLALRDWLHALARRIEPADVKATLQFAIVTLIVLPLVPDQTFGPGTLDVINPHKIWLMVVLISGINFASYVLIKFSGSEHGIGIAGLLGGFVSSTAVTLGFSQRSREPGADASALGLGILLAWTVMFFRVAVMAAVIDGALGLALARAMGVLCATSLLACWLLWRRRDRRGRGQVPATHNPFELSQAIQFGLLFGVVVFVSKAAQQYLGDAGVYLASGLAGLTDVDAITLAMADLAKSDEQALVLAARAILVAVLANTLVKGAMAVGMGSKELRRVTLPASLLLLGAGATAALLV